METWNIDIDLSNQAAQFYEEIAEIDGITINVLISSILESFALISRPSIKFDQGEK